ncbi:hypothetical protein QBC37DRAFT_301271 [Rhypophila decipiens]|uniref:Chromo domain-containing protein n=1 Tax=Rhypophila decipiens TaxID=261697 RepID=A0AAN6XTB6_9PEZI|nr:hypothetical protein QBC37DRAFT_301271 [Rhypophila decipiens]
MMQLQPDWARRGSLVQTAWSSNVVILQVLYTVTTLDRKFHGVIVENPVQARGASATDDLLWVFDDSCGLRVWQECRQRPFITEGEYGEIEQVFGHYENPTGSVYYAVKWTDYECPTWELEDDLYDSQLTTEYCIHLPGLEKH